MRTIKLWATVLFAAIALLATAALAKKPAPPSGTFTNAQGQVTLRYAGEGTVDVDLKTKYCALKSNQGATLAS